MAVASFDRAVRIFSMLFLYGQSGMLLSRLAFTFQRRLKLDPGFGTKTLQVPNALERSSQSGCVKRLGQLRTAGLNTSSHHWRKLVDVVFSGVRRSEFEKELAYEQG